MDKNEKKMFPLNLQFFADGDGENNGGEDGNNGNDSNGQNNDNKDLNNGNGQNSSDNKTFTQEQVNAMMTKEKNEGKRSVLKNLGFANEEEAKKAVDLYKALVDSQKTQEELNQQALDNLTKEKQEYFDRAEQAENKLSCFQAGVDKDSIDDVLAIAKSKITESKNLDTVLSEMKKEAKYSSFFDSGKGNSGTGSDPGHSSGSHFDSKAGNYGKTLAEKNTAQNKSEKKSSFF